MILEHLGDVLLAQKKVGEALSEYERALGASDTNERRRAALQHKIERARGTSPRS